MNLWHLIGEGVLLLLRVVQVGVRRQGVRRQADTLDKGGKEVKEAELILNYYYFEKKKVYLDQGQDNEDKQVI